MKTCADIIEMLSADFTWEYYRSMYLCLEYEFDSFPETQANRMQMISLAAIMIYDGRW